MRKMTATQAASKLNVTTTTLAAWAKKGRLKRRQVGNGKLRKTYVYDSKSVSELKEKIDHGKIKVAGFRMTNLRKNGHTTQETPTMKVFKVKDETHNPTSRLERLEKKLDKAIVILNYLEKVWS